MNEAAFRSGIHGAVPLLLVLHFVLPGVVAAGVTYVACGGYLWTKAGA